MFKIIRKIMWLEKKATGKREFAFLIFVTALVLTVWIVPLLDSEGQKSVLETWVYASLICCLAAFGFEAFVITFSEKFALKQNKKSDENPNEYSGHEEYGDEER